VTADVCIVHVDLSVVPDDYMAFARRFPLMLNGRVTDIRKSRTSHNLLQPGDPWPGPVILKTDLNYAGWPEKTLQHSRWRLKAMKAAGPLLKSLGQIQTHDHYRVFERLEDVPDRYFKDETYVVEKFLPEVEDGLYCVNCYKFFGDLHECGRSYSTEPVVLGPNTVRREYIDPEPAVVELAKSLGLDFGKIDYAMHEGRPEIFDINRTPGRLARGSNVPMERVIRRARGIERYLEALQ
ncbi:MAG: hypothetical protein AAGH19_09570, partial [Pseudomonadota bacterium]